MSNHLPIARLQDVNSSRMTPKHMYVHSFPLSLIAEEKLSGLLKEFEAQRALRQAQKDMLENNGKFIVDNDRGLLITGCDLSAKIMRGFLGANPKLTKHPIVTKHPIAWAFQTSKPQIKRGFSFAKNLKII